MNSNNVVFMRKFHFHSQCGQYVRFLTAYELQEMLTISRASAYRIMKDNRLSQTQRELLELKLFGLIPGWSGWRIEPGHLIDPMGYRYSMGEIMSIPLLKSIGRCR